MDNIYYKRVLNDLAIAQKLSFFG